MGYCIRKSFLTDFFDILFAHKNFPRLTHTKISPIYTRKNFPYIYTHKNFPTIFTLLLYLQLCYYLNNSLCLSAYLPMYKRHNVTVATVFSFAFVVILFVFSICLSCPHLSTILRMSALSFPLFTFQSVSIRHVFSIQRDCFSSQGYFSSIICPFQPLYFHIPTLYCLAI